MILEWFCQEYFENEGRQKDLTVGFKNLQAPSPAQPHTVDEQRSTVEPK